MMELGRAGLVESPTPVLCLPVSALVGSGGLGDCTGRGTVEAPCDALVCMLFSGVAWLHTVWLTQGLDLCATGPLSWCVYVMC